jgi:hypothetical protein
MSSSVFYVETLICCLLLLRGLWVWAQARQSDRAAGVVPRRRTNRSEVCKLQEPAGASLLQVCSWLESRFTLRNSEGAAGEGACGDSEAACGQWDLSAMPDACVVAKATGHSSQKNEPEAHVRAGHDLLIRLSCPAADRCATPCGGVHSPPHWLTGVLPCFAARHTCTFTDTKGFLGCFAPFSPPLAAHATLPSQVRAPAGVPSAARRVGRRPGAARGIARGVTQRVVVSRGRTDRGRTGLSRNQVV